VGGQRARGDAGELVRRAHDRDIAVLRHATDDGRRQPPAGAHLEDVRPALRSDCSAHSLLGLRDHDLEWLETRLAARDRVEVDRDPGPATVRELGGRASDPARSEVLEALDETALDELEAG